MALENWNIDVVHSTVGFTVRHLIISKVRGNFTKWSGKLAFDEQNFAASHAEATIEMASIDTREPQRDGHLRTGDFFEVEKFPSLMFKSTSIRVVRPGELAVEGELTIREITRKVLFEVEGPTPPEKDPWGNLRVAASATAKISRKEFGLVWNTTLENGGLLVGDEVTVTLDVQFVRS